MTSLAAVLLTSALLAADVSPERFEKTIAGFEKHDRESPPPTDGIVFVGSSTIAVGCDARRFLICPCLNRGYGGSHMLGLGAFRRSHRHSLQAARGGRCRGRKRHFLGQIAEQVAADFQSLVGKIHAALPETKIFLCRSTRACSAGD